ncbi:Fasciclin-like arabinogalactan protein 10 [Hibiscus syriacus]|uniref:Fasciclin-like arabinogalactan protein 10 n=1 Tax=Hibiscus syriacus TaxID=106335 RepID=A0A6A3A2Y2_HIBSY|nr:Fasciclin-like arabinogalactan protein 10 [Hibiscus syriacus]
MADANFILLILSLVAVSVNAHNITAILEGYPDYSSYNSFLSQTKLADEINTRETITCLVLNNGAMSASQPNTPCTTLTTTLYQTTGNAPGNLGFVNITDIQGGKVGFGSAIPGSKLDSSYTKSVKQIPYNISILEISAPIIAPGILSAPAPSSSGVNITGLLEKAGCKTFAALLASSGVLKTYESALDKGLTVFAPSDEAFKAKGVPDLSKLTNAEQVSLLEYHASPDYKPKGTLKTQKDPISTLATSGAGKFDLTATSAGDDVTLHTGVGPARVNEAVFDSPPVVFFTVDSVLLPTELFGKSPSPAPAPEPVSSPTPTPSPSPLSEAPSPLAASPPAPPTDTPAGSPADAPAGSSENSTSNKGAGHVTAPLLSSIVFTIFATVVSSVFLS